MRYELYDIKIDREDFWLIMSALESELCRISTRKKQDRKKLRQEYYNEQEIRINVLMDDLFKCIEGKNNYNKELDEMLEKF